MKTRVLFVVNTTEYGGLEKYLLDLVQRLDSYNVDSTILSYGKDFYSQYLSERPDVRVITSNRARQTFFSYWRAFVKLKPHVIVFVKGSIDSYPLQAYIAAKATGARRLFAIEQLVASPLPPKVTGKQIRDYLRRVAGWRARYIARYVLSKRLAGALVDKTICVSTEVRRILVDEYKFSAAKTVTIPNGVDLKRFDSLNGNDRENIRKNLRSGHAGAVLVCVSRLVPRKRIDLLLDAFSLVLREHPSAKCLIVGTGLLEEKLRARSIELGIAASVSFVGFAEDVKPYLEIGDIFVSASEKEGLPLALTEAMAYGLPCIVTNIGGHNELVLNGHNGLLVTPGSVEDLAEAMKYLVVCKEERKSMGVNSRKRVEEIFNADITMAKIKDVLLGES
jgi:glycosyltransferase involved in cell wall biosynthesis